MNESTKYTYTVYNANTESKSYSLVKKTNYDTYSDSAYSIVSSVFTEGMSYPSTVTTEYPGLDSKITETFVYDEWKNTESYTVKREIGELCAVEHTTTYAYEDGFSAAMTASTYTQDKTYGNLKTTTYKADDSTTVEIINTLTVNSEGYTEDMKNKAVAVTQTFINNDNDDRVLRSMSEFAYDNDGNIISQKLYHDPDSETGGYYETQTQYTYTVVPETENTSEYKYLSKVTVTDLDSDIYTESTYDVMGDLCMYRDADGCLSATVRDGLGRITRKAYQGGVAYDYVYDGATVTYDTPDGFKRRVRYDGFGKVLVSERLNSAGEPVVIEEYFNHTSPYYPAGERFVFSENNLYILNDGYDNFGRYVGWQRYGKDLYNYPYGDDYTASELAALEANDTYSRFEYQNVLLGEELIPCEVTTHKISGVAVDRAYTNALGQTVMTCSVLNGQNIGEIFYVYDDYGRLTRKYYLDEDDEEVLISSYTYDYDGKVLSETNFDGNTKTTTYDALGRVLTDSDFKGKFVTYEYDSLSRVTRQTTPLSGDVKSITEYEYDGRGNVVKQRISNNPDNSSTVTFRLTENAYDLFGNLTDSTVYDGNTVLSSVHYEYNNAGKVTAMYEGLSAKYNYAENRVPPTSSYKLTTYTYDYWGNPATVTYANGGVDTTAYNAYGQLIHSYSRGSMHHEYTYDMYGRNIDDTYSGGAYRTFYDSLGRVTSIGKLNGTTYDSEVAYTYDTLGRVTSEATNVDNKPVVKTFTYNEFGNKTNDVITLNGTQIYNKTSTYDEFLRLKTVAQGGKTTTYSYDDNGNLATETTGNVVTTYSYNDANMVLTMNTKSGNVDVTNFTYNYFTDGNQRTKVDTINNVTTAYTYDGAGQLITESKTGSVNMTDTYSYDASGNRVQKAENHQGGESNYTVNSINNLNQITFSATYYSDGRTTKNYYYDVFGNMTNDGEYSYTYDAYYNRLATSKNLATNQVTIYDYYVDGLRKSKGSTYYIWLDGNLVYEFSGSNSNSNTYTYGIHLATSDDYTYVLNSHGDVVALIGTTDEVVKRYEYDSYGNEISIAPTDTNPFRYCGEYYDRETGQIYLRARYYQPIIGRFSQRDTHWNTANMIYGDDLRTKEYEDYLGLNDYTVKLVDYAAIRQSGNLYGYCGNNPLYYADSKGESFAVAAVALIVCGVAVFLSGCSAHDRNAWLEQNQAQKLQVHPLTIKFTQSKLQHEFKHANDFGITGNWNSSNGAAFQKAIEAHISGVTSPIIGTYRGNQAVYHFYDPKTGIDVMVDMNGNYVCGWQLSEKQREYLETTGNVQ